MHTQGPWSVETREHSAGSITAQQRTKEELLANARLIAAAPDMLAALEQIEDSLQVAGYDFSRKTGRAIQAAIRKAKTGQ